MIKFADEIVFLTTESGEPDPVNLTSLENNLRHPIH